MLSMESLERAERQEMMLLWDVLSNQGATRKEHPFHELYETLFSELFVSSSGYSPNIISFECRYRENNPKDAKTLRVLEKAFMELRELSHPACDRHRLMVTVASIVEEAAAYSAPLAKPEVDPFLEQKRKAIVRDALEDLVSKKQSHPLRPLWIKLTGEWDGSFAKEESVAASFFCELQRTPVPMTNTRGSIRTSMPKHAYIALGRGWAMQVDETEELSALRRQIVRLRAQELPWRLKERQEFAQALQQEVAGNSNHPLFALAEAFALVEKKEEARPLREWVEEYQRNHPRDSAVDRFLKTLLHAMLDQHAIVDSTMLQQWMQRLPELGCRADHETTVYIQTVTGITFDLETPKSLTGLEIKRLILKKKGSKLGCDLQLIVGKQHSLKDEETLVLDPCYPRLFLKEDTEATKCDFMVTLWEIFNKR